MISVEHLTKYYGEHLAVEDLSFEIGDCSVYGFLGPNGAGKSTTMNIIAGCLSATEGTVKIDGYDIFEEPLEAKRRIGYLPEQPPLYMNESVEEYLRFVGRAKGLSREERKAQTELVMAETGITGVRNQRIAALSKGYKQRVGIAQALLGNPGVIILDEPTVGLDPLQIIEIRELIQKLGEKHTVILSSHILPEVQAICSRVLMIAKGKLVAFDTPENLEKQLLAAHEVTITTDAAPEAAGKLLDGLAAVNGYAMETVGDGRLRIRVKTDLPDIYVFSGELFRAFAGEGLTMQELSLKKGSLEDVFLELAEEPAAQKKEEAQA